MKRLSLSLLAAACLLASSTSADEPRGQSADQWGQWRGPLANGIAPGGDPPTQWSEEKNIRWKTSIPGHGLSTPIVWGDLVFIQTAVRADGDAESGHAASPGAGDERRADGHRPEGSRPPGGGEGPRGAGRDGDGPRGEGPPGDGRRGDGPPREGRPPGEGRRGERGMRNAPPTDTYKFVVMALDRKSGKLVWEKTVREQVPHEGSHQDGSLAPGSPVIDGEHLIANFGSRGIYGMTLSGEVLWEKDLGDMQTRNGFGEGGSPALHRDTLVVNWDHEGDSFIVALDKKTGAETWRRPRDERTSWSTPYILEDSGKTLAVVSATGRIRAYDLATGEVQWECGGLGANVIPTPVVDDRLLYAMSGFRDDTLLAIQYRGAQGDLTESASVAWRIHKGVPYVPSALLYNGRLYLIQKNTEMLSCYEAATGQPHYTQQRLEEISGTYASPVAAKDRVYIIGRNGAAYVLKDGPEFRTLAVNKLDDEFSASPAIVSKELFLRGHKSLYCIAE